MSKYFITKNIKLASALMTFGHEMTYFKDGKTTYFQFETSAVLEDLMTRYENKTLGNGLIAKHEKSISYIKRILKEAV